MEEPDVVTWVNDPTGLRCEIERNSWSGTWSCYVFPPENIPEGIKLDQMGGRASVFLSMEYSDEDGVYHDIPNPHMRASFTYLLGDVYCPRPEFGDEQRGTPEQYKDLGLMIKKTNNLAFQLAEWARDEALVTTTRKTQQSE